MYNIYVFDFDYTIAKTIEHILIWSPRGTSRINNKNYIPVHPNNFKHYNIASDEEINDASFQEFYSVNIEKAIPIMPIIEYIQLYSIHNNILILSARPQESEIYIYKFLSQYLNIDIVKNKIKFIGLKSSYAIDKINYIHNNLICSNTNKITIFEDNFNVLLEIKKNKKNNIIYDLRYVHYVNNKINISYYE